MLSGAMRMVVDLPALDRLFRHDIFARYVASDRETDALSFISHRHFLVAGLSVKQRVGCATGHFVHEGRCYVDHAYHAAVYGGTGLELWREEKAGVRYSMWLRSSRNLRHEGPASIVLVANDIWLHETSFAWVDAALFRSPEYHGPVMFLTRNQSVPSGAPPLSTFRKNFPQNSPRYFCFAAAHGIAQLQGHTHIAGVKAQSQVSFDEKYATSFQRSYDEFWATFGGIELDRYAFMMPSPEHLPPIAEVEAKHRSRAHARRYHWGRIIRSTSEALETFRRSAGT